MVNTRCGMHQRLSPLIVSIVGKISHPTQQTAVVLLFRGDINKLLWSLC